VRRLKEKGKRRKENEKKRVIHKREEEYIYNFKIFFQLILGLNFASATDASVAVSELQAINKLFPWTSILALEVCFLSLFRLLLIIVILSIFFILFLHPLKFSSHLGNMLGIEVFNSILIGLAQDLRSVLNCRFLIVILDW
jgi:hypothetical protein